MCIRDSPHPLQRSTPEGIRDQNRSVADGYQLARRLGHLGRCLLYTSDAADERSSVDLGGRRIIKKKTSDNDRSRQHNITSVYIVQHYE